MLDFVTKHGDGDSGWWVWVQTALDEMVCMARKWKAIAEVATVANVLLVTSVLEDCTVPRRSAGNDIGEYYSQGPDV